MIALCYHPALATFPTCQEVGERLLCVSRASPPLGSPAEPAPALAAALSFTLHHIPAT